MSNSGESVRDFGELSFPVGNTLVILECNPDTALGLGTIAFQFADLEPLLANGPLLFCRRLLAAFKRRRTPVAARSKRSRCAQHGDNNVGRGIPEKSEFTHMLMSHGFQ